MTSVKDSEMSVLLRQIATTQYQQGLMLIQITAAIQQMQNELPGSRPAHENLWNTAKESKEHFAQLKNTLDEIQT